jgi:antitoxin component YwqK of YwqJK toxin-antitoxin module
LSRIDFFRLHGDEFFRSLVGCIDQELGEGQQRTRRWALLNSHAQGAHAWWYFWGDVENGGLTQFFYNHTDATVPALEGLLNASGNGPMASLLKQATKVYRKHKKQFDVENPFGEDGLFARMTELTKLDRPVVRLLGRTRRQLEKWLRANITLVTVGDTGDPIDPKFSGELETYHPNGKVFEQVTVRRGVLSGPYRRYFKDGTLEHACFYRRGELSANYWPNGQLKHRRTKRDKLTTDEWYYPSGNLQKRYVANQQGYAVEPVRLWYDNGQLAEEIHTVKGDKFGPWLKFFEDGSPRLQAEHRKDEVLVVKNAWDDDRRQVVKNGRGAYFDDGIDFSVSYDLKLEHSWTRLRELRNGRPHGAGTTWHDGVLWSTENHVNGKLDGMDTLFYNNGRVRTRTTYRNGKAVRRETFPKFDDPRPVVLLRVEANAGLYEAWNHALLEDYPTARNLEKIQARITVPAFLQEVFERNQFDAKRDSYEDINTFDDNMAYFVTVSNRGVVESVDFSGCGVYSVGMVERYPPIIRELRFRPGRVRGRNVRSRAIVWVHHTFEEAGPKMAPK